MISCHLPLLHGLDCDIISAQLVADDSNAMLPTKTSPPAIKLTVAPAPRAENLLTTRDNRGGFAFVCLHVL